MDHILITYRDVTFNIKQICVCVIILIIHSSKLKCFYFLLCLTLQSFSFGQARCQAYCLASIRSVEVKIAFSQQYCLPFFSSLKF